MPHLRIHPLRPRIIIKLSQQRKGLSGQSLICITDYSITRTQADFALASPTSKAYQVTLTSGLLRIHVVKQKVHFHFDVKVRGIIFSSCSISHRLISKTEANKFLILYRNIYRFTNKKRE